MGCNGGLMDNAFKYIEKNGGLCTEADYPYVSGDTAHQHFLCLQKNCKVVTDATPRNFTDVQVDSEAALMSAVSMQPVSIAIEADQKDFQLYKSGDIPLLGLYPTTPPLPPCLSPPTQIIRLKTSSTFFIIRRIYCQMWYNLGPWSVGGRLWSVGG